jgi:hypothetical protein
MLLAAGAPSAFAFSLLGPFPTGAADGFEQPIIGYQLAGDIGTPKNKGEEYRWNTRTLYYAFDANFSDYFGTKGMAAVDQAFAILNGLTNVSSYSSDLSEWPLTSKRVNFQAQALSLLDLKSWTLNLLVEQLGLAEPERYAWTLHNRFLPPGGTCPVSMEYVVVMRNFDPVTYDYSPYVNGTLYSYSILEFCTGPNPLAETLPFAVDPVADTYTAVASTPPPVGTFFTGLTRDDVGGLRYLMATNRMHVEPAATNSLLVVTNNLTPTLLFTSNLTAFADQSFTNPAATLLGLYPGLVITNETTYFTNVTITNVTSYFTNNPTDPVGTPPHLVFVTNTTPGFVQRFLHGFANVVTNLPIYSNSFVTVQTTQPVYPPNFPAGQFYNQTTLTTAKTNIINGDIYIVPTNQCGFQIISTILTNVVATTNIIVPTTTAAAGQTFGESIITYSTNHVYVLDVFQCVSNSVALRQGVEKINFVRRDFDSLINQFWEPVTNIYNLTAVTNSTVYVETFQRVVSRPDILFSAQDLIFGGPNGLFTFPAAARSISFNQSQVLPNLAGPGTIDSSVFITFNKAGPIFLSPGLFFLGFPPVIQNQGTASLVYQWGSFDGTTNAPTVYPDTASLTALQNQILMQVTTGPLPNGKVGSAYPLQQLGATGGAPPYAWSLAPSSPALPAGLALSASGVISGTPTVVGIFDFVVQATDSSSPSRVTQRNLTIEVDP